MTGAGDSSNDDEAPSEAPADDARLWGLSALEAALALSEELVFVVGAHGRVIAASPAGHALMRRDAQGARNQMQSAMNGAGPLQSMPVAAAPGLVVISGPCPEGGVCARAHRWAIHAELSPREEDVLWMVGTGLPNAAIATALSITRRTVEAHVGRLLRALRVANRAELTATLWVDPPPSAPIERPSAKVRRNE